VRRSAIFQSPYEASYKHRNVACLGTLVAVGGAEDKRDEMLILRRALDEVPGGVRRVEVLPTASREPLLAAQPHADAFRALGVPEVGVLDVRIREQAEDDAFAARVRGADLLYMTGGDQARLGDVLRGTPLLAALQDKLANGGVVAGTSAGAAAMTGTMIAQGEPTLRKGSVRLAPGLGLLDGLVIDTHFTERGRFARLIEAVATHPRLLGVGIGEDTAIVVRGGEMRVVGAGSVVVMDAGEMRASNVQDAAHDQPVSVARVILHTLADGDVLPLATRMGEAAVQPDGVEARA